MKEDKWTSNEIAFKGDNSASPALHKQTKDIHTEFLCKSWHKLSLFDFSFRS
jgi:hypothetical protein